MQSFNNESFFNIYIWKDYEFTSDAWTVKQNRQTPKGEKNWLSIVCYYECKGEAVFYPSVSVRFLPSPIVWVVTERMRLWILAAGMSSL